MKLIIVNDLKAVGLRGAELVAEEIRKNQNLVLGLATGGTMIPFYKSLVNLFRKKNLSFLKVRSFNLDEYVGLNGKDKRSFRYFMDKNFFSKVDISKRNIHFLDGNAKNLYTECKNYENEIGELGGIDLQILGIGKDGHIGFNEPGSDFNSRTREVLLRETTRRNNAKFFSGKEEKVPKKALTMGIATIMSARKIILLASGKSKSDAIAGALNGEISEKAPASVLMRHRDVAFIIDKNAAAKLRK